MIHQAPGHLPIACTTETGKCRICELVATNEHYRRLFEPEGANEPAAQAPQPSVIHAGEGPVAQAPQPSVTLAGDLVEGLAKRIGADRAAKWIAAKLGAEDCGCEWRRQALNRVDAAARKFLGW
jgi:hypothetical protein